MVASEEKSHTAKGTAHHSFGSILVFHDPGYATKTEADPCCALKRSPDDLKTLQPAGRKACS